MKKVLYIARIFSGLEVSINNNFWNPSGVPTIYKLIEALDKDFELKIIFTEKNKEQNIILKKDNFNYSLNGLKANIVLLHSYKKTFLHKYFFIIIEFIQFLKIIKISLFYKPDVIYIGNANIWTGAFLKIIGYKTIFRVMGVYDAMRYVYKKNNIKNLILRFSYLVKYNALIFTQDGSGIENWQKKATKSVNLFNLINGVPNIPKHIIEKNFSTNKINILFLGRLEPMKGIIEFLSIADQLTKKFDNVKINILGSGILEKKIEEFIVNNQQIEVNFIKVLEHNKVVNFIKNMDIYISINKRGNLSNATLECISQGLVTFVLNEDKKTEKDYFTNKFLPDNIFFKIDRQYIVESAVKQIAKLIENTNLINKHKFETLEFAKKNLILWENRIQSEMNIIKDVVNAKK